MSDTQFDQNAWFARIGYSGSVTPTLETLNRLILAHSHTIAYETLDIMLGRPPQLDVATLQDKMIASKRGAVAIRQLRRSLQFGQKQFRPDRSTSCRQDVAALRDFDAVL
jgi:hypothetical protein